MTHFDEARISKAILDAYHRKVSRHLVGDVAIVGAGPSGLLAAGLLADRGLNVVVVEKRLTPGGGVWGGAMCMNEVAIQQEALSIIDMLKVRHVEVGEGLHTVDAMELASALTLNAVHCGATILNMMTVEDVCIDEGKVNGVVVNRTLGPTPLPIDPMTLMARAVVDATGHETILLALLQRRGLLDEPIIARRLGDGPMNAVEGERFVVERAGEVFPGLWICGMAVCAAYAGPRMGPIFGGMLLSGQRLAGMIADELQQKQAGNPTEPAAVST